MIFEAGKTYDGYEVESRTKCFVTFKNAANFRNASKKKIRILDNGMEYTDNLHGYDDSIILAREEIKEAPETFFIPVVAVFDNRAAKALPADHAHAMATPYKAPIVGYDEIEVIAASLGYSLLNMSTLKKPVYRLMRDGLMIASNLYGMG